MKVLSVSLLGAALVTGAGFAQTTSSVSGPAIDAGEHEVEYRIAAGFSESLEDAALAHRLHVQAALSDSLRWRVRALWRDPESGPSALDHVQAELHWQSVERTAAGYASGFRFNVRASQQPGDADEAGLTWLHQWSPSSRWRVRALASVDHEFGAGASHDWMFETRMAVKTKLGAGLSLGLESFNDFSGDSHQIGPVLSGDLVAGVEWSKGVLFGLSEEAEDLDLMLRVSQPL
jgi:hypothetical protein